MQNPPVVCMLNPLELKHCMLSNEISGQLRSSLYCESQFGQLKMLYPKIKMLWTISNFNNFINRDGNYVKAPLNSPSLFIGIHGNYIMNLLFYLGNPQQTENEFTSMYICVSNLETKEDVKVRYKIDVVDAQGCVFKSFCSKEIISKTFGSASGFSEFLKRKEILDASNKLLMDNKFRVCCSVEIYDSPSKNVQKFENRLGVSYDLNQLLQDDTFSDVTFVVSNEKFPAHRNILAARSPVFRAMFTNDMQEKRTHEVLINDIKPEVFKRLLLYIYCGSVELDPKIACELLMAADKYALDDLKNLCEVKLSLEINLNNVIDILIIADRHNVANLKKQALNCIANNAKAITSTSRYQTWSTSGDPLIGEAFRALATKL